MNNMTNEQREVLEQTDFSVLADWYCILSRCQWPGALPGPIPDLAKYGGNDIMEWISDRVGEKACLRAWNGQMTDADFEIFWRAEHEGDVEAQKLYEERLKRVVEDDENERG